MERPGAGICEALQLTVPPGGRQNGSRALGPKNTKTAGYVFKILPGPKKNQMCGNAESVDAGMEQEQEAAWPGKDQQTCGLISEQSRSNQKFTVTEMK